MVRAFEVALALGRGAPREGFVEGVLRYAAERQRTWSYVRSCGARSLSVVDLVGWPGDGILTALTTAAEAQCAATLSVPVVNVSSVLARSPTPRSAPADAAIGLVAAEHLMARGFHHFAYFGPADDHGATIRRRGFSRRLADDGFDCRDFPAAPRDSDCGVADWLGRRAELAAWLAEFPAACAVLADSDCYAQQVLAACRAAGLGVPDRIAVMGVGNDELICEHSRPTITSVARNDIQEGYRAAAMLDRLMHGERVPLDDPATPPRDVVERESTSTFAVEDDRLRDALAYLHQHIDEPITIDQVILHTGVSRRWLEYAFRRTLHETPYQYLRRQRLALAKRLLAEDPAAKVQRVAERSGFSSAKHLAIAFQQSFGMTPRDYRKSSQG